MPPVTAYRRPTAGTQPDYLFPRYASTVKRAPTQPLVMLPQTQTELTGPVFGYGEVKRSDHDLTKQHAGDPIGERIIVSGRVLDENARPVPNALVEVWQANSAGRYPHRVDQHDAPTDPNFTGAGRALTDKRGHYRFVTIRPGEYPWRNHYNAWRPAHIHFSLFGPAFATRLVTQMYFPGEPLNGQDRILNAVPDAQARGRLIARLAPPTGDPHNALVFEHQIVLRGRKATPSQP